MNLSNISTDDLLRAAKERKAQLSASLGKYATLKRPVLCPYECGAPEMGVRELQRHKRVCPNNPNKNKGPKNKSKSDGAARAEQRRR